MNNNNNNLQLVTLLQIQVYLQFHQCKRKFYVIKFIIIVYNKSKYDVIKICLRYSHLKCIKS